MELIFVDRLTVQLDLLVAFQLLEEVYSRPFSLFYCFLGSVPIFFQLCFLTVFSPFPLHIHARTRLLGQTILVIAQVWLFVPLHIFPLILFVGEQIQQMKCN